MRDLLKQAPPTRFEDIIALVALYRPGPMELIPDYIARKSGRERVEYLDPRLEPILEPTYGVMVYQEQVMQIAQVIGGYTLGAADLLRRAMGKKKPEEMAKQRDIFVAGAEKNGLATAKATQLFDLMEKFAGYGFNKSHAAAYALVAYQTAYFKAHHAAAFMAANLSLVMDDTDKVQRVLRRRASPRARRSCRPTSTRRTTVSSPSTSSSIRYGLGGDQGHGRSGHRTRSSPRATPAARSPTCSTSAAASTSASSTGAPSRRSCAPAHSTRSIRGVRRCSRRSAWRSTPANARSPRRRRCRCSARKRRRARSQR